MDDKTREEAISLKIRLLREKSKNIESRHKLVEEDKKRAESHGNAVSSLKPISTRSSKSYGSHAHMDEPFKVDQDDPHKPTQQSKAANYQRKPGGSGGQHEEEYGQGDYPNQDRSQREAQGRDYRQQGRDSLHGEHQRGQDKSYHTRDYERGNGPHGRYDDHRRDGKREEQQGNTEDTRRIHRVPNRPREDDRSYRNQSIDDNQQHNRNSQLDRRAFEREQQRKHNIESMDAQLSGKLQRGDKDFQETGGFLQDSSRERDGEFTKNPPPRSVRYSPNDSRSRHSNRNYSGQDGEMNRMMAMTGKERQEYDRWKKQQEEADNQRLARSQTDGHWKRDWDTEKKAEDFEDDRRDRHSYNRGGRRGGRFDRRNERGDYSSASRPMRKEQEEYERRDHRSQRVPGNRSNYHRDSNEERRPGGYQRKDGSRNSSTTEEENWGEEERRPLDKDGPKPRKSSGSSKNERGDDSEETRGEVDNQKHPASEQNRKPQGEDANQRHQRDEDRRVPFKNEDHNQRRENWGQKSDNQDQRENWGQKKDDQGERDDWSHKRDNQGQRENWGQRRNNQGQPGDWSKKKDTQSQGDDWDQKRDDQAQGDVKRDNQGQRENWDRKRGDQGQRNYNRGIKRGQWAQRRDNQGPRRDDRDQRRDDQGPRRDDRNQRRDDQGPRSDDRDQRRDDQGPRSDDRDQRRDDQGPRRDDRDERRNEHGQRRNDMGQRRGHQQNEDRRNLQNRQNSGESQRNKASEIHHKSATKQPDGDGWGKYAENDWGGETEVWGAEDNTQEKAKSPEIEGKPEVSKDKADEIEEKDKPASAEEEDEGGFSSDFHPDDDEDVDKTVPVENAGESQDLVTNEMENQKTKNKSNLKVRIEDNKKPSEASVSQANMERSTSLTSPLKTPENFVPVGDWALEVEMNSPNFDSSNQAPPLEALIDDNKENEPTTVAENQTAEDNNATTTEEPNAATSDNPTTAPSVDDAPPKDVEVSSEKVSLLSDQENDVIMDDEMSEKDEYVDVNDLDSSADKSDDDSFATAESDQEGKDSFEYQKLEEESDNDDDLATPELSLADELNNLGEDLGQMQNDSPSPGSSDKAGVNIETEVEDEDASVKSDVANPDEHNHPEEEVGIDEGTKQESMGSLDETGSTGDDLKTSEDMEVPQHKDEETAPTQDDNKTATLEDYQEVTQEKTPIETLEVSQEEVAQEKPSTETLDVSQEVTQEKPSTEPLEACQEELTQEKPSTEPLEACQEELTQEKPSTEPLEACQVTEVTEKDSETLINKVESTEHDTYDSPNQEHAIQNLNPDSTQTTDINSDVDTDTAENQSFEDGQTLPEIVLPEANDPETKLEDFELADTGNPEVMPDTANASINSVNENLCKESVDKSSNVVGSEPNNNEVSINLVAKLPETNDGNNE